MAGMEDPVDFLLFDVIVFLGFGVSELFRGRAPTDETVTDRSLTLPVDRDMPICVSPSTSNLLCDTTPTCVCNMGQKCSVKVDTVYRHNIDLDYHHKCF